MRAVLTAVVLLPLLAGCHARFKKHVASIEDVRAQVIVTTGPEVLLAGGGTPDLTGAVVGVVQGVRAEKAADRLGEAVDIDGVNRSFQKGLRNALQDGPPFGLSKDDDASLLQVEVVGYGLSAPVMGAPGTLHYDLKVSIYLPDGKKVYHTRQSCHVGFGDASGLAVALGTVDNVKQLEQMSDEEIQGAFASSASTCGAELVMRMRQHASPSGIQLDAVADTLGMSAAE